MTGWTAAAVLTASLALAVALLLARRHTELVAMLTEAGVVTRPRPARARRPAAGAWLPTVGSAVPGEVFAVTTAGEVVTAASFAGPDVVLVFLASSCPPCRVALPDVRAALLARHTADGTGPLPLAVLGGPEHECAEYEAALSDLARVVRDGDAKTGGLASTLGVLGNPAVLVLGGGVVRAAGMTAADVLPPVVPATTPDDGEPDGNGTRPGPAGPSTDRNGTNAQEVRAGGVRVPGATGGPPVAGPPAR
jgi:hypothetical protein